MVTAVLGTCKVEEIVGVQRLTSEGNVCLSSTPTARQMADDIRKMSHLSEEVGEWYAQRTSDAAIFTTGCWEIVRFLEFLVEELREAKMAYRFPESEQEEMEEIDGRLVELEEPFVCDENEVGREVQRKICELQTTDGATERENMASELCSGC